MTIKLHSAGREVGGLVSFTLPGEHYGLDWGGDRIHTRTCVTRGETRHEGHLARILRSNAPCYYLPAAQQTTGVPGSPSATTTIDGSHLPPQPAPFGATINLDAKDSKPVGHRPWCRPKVRPTQRHRLVHSLRHSTTKRRRTAG